MARTRRSGMELLEDQIEKAQEDVVATKKKYDQATATLKQLLDKKQAMQQKELMEAVAKSHRSYQEILAFLQTEEKE